MKTCNSNQSGVAQYIRRNYDAIRSCPREGLFSVHVTDVGREGQTRALRNKGILTPVTTLSTTECGSSVSGPVTIWELSDEALDALDSMGDGRKMEMPCGHTGFRNLSESPFLQCAVCGGRFTKAEVMEG